MARVIVRLDIGAVHHDAGPRPARAIWRPIFEPTLPQPISVHFSEAGVGISEARRRRGTEMSSRWAAGRTIFPLPADKASPPDNSTM